MPKTITVTDAQGNVYQSTYAKRARGLVKHGRAVYLDDNCICLTCPPCQQEEHAMTANDILQKIFELSQDKKHIDDAIAALQNIPNIREFPPGSPPDVTGQAKADAIASIATGAEQTRQQLLAFYIRLYDDLTGHPHHPPMLPNAPQQVDHAALAMKIAETFADPT